MKEYPLVSIVIPVYNGANYLGEAIDSALAQTYPNIEVIVVNDGSTDETEEIALSYGERIRYVRKENGGVSTALNLGIEQMGGEYFSWLSHDDVYHPNKVERQLALLWERGRPQALLFGAYEFLHMDTGKRESFFPHHVYPAHQLERSVFAVIKQQIGGCAMLVHRSHFHRAGLFDPALRSTQDYELWFRMFRGQEIVYQPEALTVIRQHEQQGIRTMSHHTRDEVALYIGFMNALTHEDAREMGYRELYHLYGDMLPLFRDGPRHEVYRYLCHTLQSMPMPKEAHRFMKRLDEQIRALSDNKAERICIFCAGAYGIRLYHALRQRMIRVDCFADNAPEKQGYLMDGVHCYSMEELAKEKDRVLVMVATRSPGGIVGQLEEKGFPYVTTKQELDSIIAETPVNKYLAAMDSLEDVDYADPQVRRLTERFNRLAFDICKYYEERI